LAIAEQWASGSIKPIDIPQGVDFYADLLKVSNETAGPRSPTISGCSKSASD
jgi:hypothetical protein